MEPPAPYHHLSRLWPTSILCFLLFLALPHPATAQAYYDYGFTRRPDIIVSTPTDTLSAPWVGGINGARFSEIDLNLDGTPDLVAFEKHGNRILPFLQENGQYLFAPQYIPHFPQTARLGQLQGLQPGRQGRHLHLRAGRHRRL